MVAGGAAMDCLRAARGADEAMTRRAVVASVLENMLEDVDVCVPVGLIYHTGWPDDGTMRSVGMLTSTLYARLVAIQSPLLGFSGVWRVSLCVVDG